MRKQSFCGFNLFLKEIRLYNALKTDRKSYSASFGVTPTVPTQVVFEIDKNSKNLDVQRQDDVIVKNNVKFVISVQNPIRKMGTHHKIGSGEIIKHPSADA